MASPTGGASPQWASITMQIYEPLSKTGVNDKTQKMIQIPYLDISSMLLSGQEPSTSNFSHLFWNLEDPVLVQTLSYRRKITYHPLLIGFFNAGYWTYVAFTCHCSSTYSFHHFNAPVYYLLPMTKMLN